MWTLTASGDFDGDTQAQADFIAGIQALFGPLPSAPNGTALGTFNMTISAAVPLSPKGAGVQPLPPEVTSVDAAAAATVAANPANPAGPAS